MLNDSKIQHYIFNFNFDAVLQDEKKLTQKREKVRAQRKPSYGRWAWSWS